MKIRDTVAAISTPAGKGGIAVIRISGEDAVSVADKVFMPKNGKRTAELESGKMTYGEIKRGGETVDEGLAVLMRAPRSFTGEDTVEINCHGGILVTQKVLEACLMAGARLAEAGEFTRRAFVNGKMGLGRAEALAELLEAQNEEQLKLSRNNLSGRVEKECERIYGELTAVLASIYAKVDFPDEDLASLDENEMRDELVKIRSEISALGSTYKTGHAVMEGIKTVICGKPNVGKSSLYNRLVGYDAAIVSRLEGTTRDVLSEKISFGRVVLRLFDTAGIRDTEDEIEQIGVERAKLALGDAELVLMLFDNSRPLDGHDREIMDDLKNINAPKIAIINKNDENSMIDEHEISKDFESIIRISAKENENIDELKNAVEALYINEEIDTSNDAVITNARQSAALESAAARLESAVLAIENGFSADVAGVDVELAMSELSKLEGREVGEDIIGEIFSHFCVGK